MKLTKKLLDFVNLGIKLSLSCMLICGMAQMGELIIDWISDRIDDATDFFKELCSK